MVLKNENFSEPFLWQIPPTTLLQRLSVTALSLAIRPETPADADAIERLHERAFGPGRFARTAFRLREGSQHTYPLSFTALVGTLLVGSSRLTPILAGNVEALLLGPLTVEPAFMNRGIGAALMERGLEAARETNNTLILLIGDEKYYGRFGFKKIQHGQLTLPGPTDPSRLLAIELVEGALAEAKGAVTIQRQPA
jgi:predicted N-acetyltransferase YhbS